MENRSAYARPRVVSTFSWTPSAGTIPVLLMMTGVPIVVPGLSPLRSANLFTVNPAESTVIWTGVETTVPLDDVPFMITVPVVPDGVPGLGLMYAMPPGVSPSATSARVGHV